MDTVLGPILRVPPHPVTAARFGMRGLWPARTLAIGSPPTAHGPSSQVSARTRPATSATFSPVPRSSCSEQQATHPRLPVRQGRVPGHRRRSRGPFDRPRRRDHDGDLGGLPRRPSGCFGIFARFDAGASRRGSSLEDPTRRASHLARWKHGPAAFKVDYATSEPVPWHDDTLRRAGTVHVGGTLDEVAAAEQAPWEGRHTERPFLLLAQPSVFDGTRAPDGQHTVLGLCACSQRIRSGHHRGDQRPDREVRTRVSGDDPRQARDDPGRLCSIQPEQRGGDIGAGAFGVRQVAARPRLSLNPYRLGDGVYLCSAATPPGAGVHGMNGYYAAKSALKELTRCPD